MSTLLRYRHNVMNVTSINSFAHISGGLNNGCKDVYFLRLLGVNESFIKDLKAMDELLGLHGANGTGFYKRVCELPKLSAYEDSVYYSEQYDKWIKGGKKDIMIKGGSCKNENFRQILSEAFQKAEQLYMGCEQNSSASMVKNFMVKLLFWTDFVLGEEYEWGERMNSKLVVSNVSKKQEYFFWYMMSMIGNDVLLLQCEKDIELALEYKELSEACVIGNYAHVEIPAYIKPERTEKKNGTENPKVVDCVTATGSKEETTTRKVQVVIPKRERKRGEQSPTILDRGQQMPAQNQTNIRREKSYEELALMASSVVLILVHDRGGKVIGSGSGIMIGRDGYILTNNHVACGGQYYSVKIEEDDEIYETDEVIKYNSVLDLAVIRIQRKLNPLPIYKGAQKLVRGQKVVAIGSPLGLFNSVSDGIISGFRVIDNVDMIQFTAPISNGSSGGAVLNTYGEVIGISTAGIDSGQNLNLAVGYECMNTFVKGFV